MVKMMTKTTFTVGLLVMLLSVPAFGATVNKSIKVGAGEEAGGATSVNGSITIGAEAVVTGNVKTVNGSIRVDAGASIEKAATVNGGVRIAENVESESLNTVNGSIRVGPGCTVDGEIEAVNGRIFVENGASVANSVGNVNGEIELFGTSIGGNVSTVTGDVSIMEGTAVDGDLIVEKPGGWGWDKKKQRKPRIVIGPGSTIAGTIALEREVDLFISDTANIGTVSGVMTIDDAVRFSGNKP